MGKDLTMTLWEVNNDGVRAETSDVGENDELRVKMQKDETKVRHENL